MRAITEKDLQVLHRRLDGIQKDFAGVDVTTRALRALISSTDASITAVQADLAAALAAQESYDIALQQYIMARLAAIETAFAAIDQRRPTVMMGHIPEPQKFTEVDTFGGLQLLATGVIDGSAPSSVVTVKGTGKIVVVVNSGTGLSGNITITGNSVDRETGTVTVADSESLKMVWGTISVNNNGTDADGNATVDLQKCYISTKWWQGSVTLSGDTSTKCNASVYHCSYEQFNDSNIAELQTLDVNLYTTNANAWFYAYLYHVEVNPTGLGNTTCQIVPIADVSIPGGSALANEYWRLRRGDIGVSMSSAHSGVFMTLFNGPATQKYIQDLEWRLWAKVLEGELVVISSAGGSLPAVPSPEEPRIPST